MDGGCFIGAHIDGVVHDAQVAIEVGGEVNRAVTSVIDAGRGVLEAVVARRGIDKERVGGDVVVHPCGQVWRAGIVGRCVVKVVACLG